MREVNHVAGGWVMMEEDEKSSFCATKKATLLSTLAFSHMVCSECYRQLDKLGGGGEMPFFSQIIGKKMMNR